ncbi:7392_t:CDS:2, partial [Racocetra persica]
CNHYLNEYNLKNLLDMHKCSVQIITKVILSEVNTNLPMRMIIRGNHVLQSIIQQITTPSQINLSHEVCDLAIISHQANKRTTKEIKMKLLASYNGVSQYELEQLYRNQNSISKQGLQPILRGLILCWFHIMQTLAFKAVGHSKTKEEALELVKAYQAFIESLPLMFLSSNDIPGIKPMTTNNLTERMNRSIEEQHR